MRAGGSFISYTPAAGAVRRSRKDLAMSLAHPPLSDRRFWLAQISIAGVFCVYLVIDVAQDQGVVPVPGFVGILLLSIPVAYAGMTFGLVGSFGTAMVGTLAFIPLVLCTPHSSAELWGAWSALTMVLVTAVVLGDRYEELWRVARAQATTEEMVKSEERFRLAFDGDMAGMALADLDGQVLRVNRALCEMLGRSEKELVGENFLEYTHPQDRALSEEINRQLATGEVDQRRFAKRFLHKNGEVVYTEISRSLARDEKGAPFFVITSIRDTTAERSLIAQLSHQALHDQLTGLPNRALLQDRLATAHARGVRRGGRSALFLLDLDDFKGVNDTFGHPIGDQLLVALARRLEEVTRSPDTLCRFGGDEFVYLAEGLTGDADAEEIATRLLGVFTEPFVIAGIAMEQRVSIGVAVSDAASDDGYAELIQNADIAVYEAKRRGPGQHVLFTAAMSELVSDRFTLTQDLGHALTRNELVMHYEPIVDLGTGEIAGYEALMRWRHPERGWVPPDVFIPLAEQSDLIVKLGVFALGEVTAGATSWDREFGILPPPRTWQSISPPASSMTRTCCRSSKRRSRRAGSHPSAWYWRSPSA